VCGPLPFPFNGVVSNQWFAVTTVLLFVLVGASPRPDTARDLISTAESLAGSALWYDLSLVEGNGQDGTI
jgi:hypothetical protein